MKEKKVETLHELTNNASLVHHTAVTVPWIYPLAMYPELNRNCQAAAHEVTLSLCPARENRKGCLLPQKNTLFHVMFLAFCTHTTPTTNTLTEMKRRTLCTFSPAQQTAVGISRTESVCWPFLCQTDEYEITAWKYVRTEVKQPRVFGYYLNNDHNHFVEAKHKKTRNNYTVAII